MLRYSLLVSTYISYGENWQMLLYRLPTLFLETEMHC